MPTRGGTSKNKGSTHECPFCRGPVECDRACSHGDRTKVGEVDVIRAEVAALGEETEALLTEYDAAIAALSVPATAENADGIAAAIRNAKSLGKRAESSNKRYGAAVERLGEVARMRSVRLGPFDGRAERRRLSSHVKLHEGGVDVPPRIERFRLCPDCRRRIDADPGIRGVMGGDVAILAHLLEHLGVSAVDVLSEAYHGFVAEEQDRMFGGPLSSTERRIETRTLRQATVRVYMEEVQAGTPWRRAAALALQSFDQAILELRGSDDQLADELAASRPTPTSLKTQASRFRKLEARAGDIAEAIVRELVARRSTDPE